MKIINKIRKDGFIAVELQDKYNDKKVWYIETYQGKYCWNQIISGKVHYSSHQITDIKTIKEVLGKEIVKELV